MALGADTLLAGIIAYAVLLASFVVACGVIWRAIRNLASGLRELDRRVQKLHDLTDPNGKNGNHPPKSPMA